MSFFEIFSNIVNDGISTIIADVVISGEKKLLDVVKTRIAQKWKTHSTKQVTDEKKLNILNQDLIRIEGTIKEYKKIKLNLQEQIDTLKIEAIKISNVYANEISWDQFVKLKDNCKDAEERISNKLAKLKFELEEHQEMLTELYKTRTRIICCIEDLNFLNEEEIEDEN